MPILRRRSLFVVGFWIAFLFGVVVSTDAAQVPETDKSLIVEPAPEAVPEVDSPPSPNPDEKERRIKFTAGLAALAGIIILGVVLGAIIIIWAGRLRRIVREPTPTTGRQDPFWFLRPDKTLLSPDTDETDTTPSEPS